MIQTVCADSYRVSERVVLRPGIRFRARGGPQFKLTDGTVLPMAAKGPFVFRRHCRRGRYEWIEAGDREGANAILHIAGRRKTVDEGIIPRPYTIKSVIRKKARAR